MVIAPMLLHQFTPPFDDLPFEESEYISELKLDGFRMTLSKWDNKIKLYTRHLNEITSKFPEFLNIDIPNGTVLDGEVVVTDSYGKPDFEETMSRFAAGKNGEQQAQFCVFDILYYKGERVTSKPLIERKELLESILVPNDSIVLVQWTRGNAEALFNLTKEQGLEGIVLKAANSRYKIKKRSYDWRKVVHFSYAQTYILGVRKGDFGLLLGLEEAGKIRPVGVMEFMTPEARKHFYRIHRDFIVGEDKKYVYLAPKIKIKVKFRCFTKTGKLRIPSFVEYIDS
ncbi:ATP-dependent DNA ligase [Mesobacillus zeae]|uniref:ATP-dependent DNA ligase n=1 Tax=Mesobacillus zeae TaxID=1917180 RepID=UPI003009E023